jgi:hypothetical protein
MKELFTVLGWRCFYISTLINWPGDNICIFLTYIFLQSGANVEPPVSNNKGEAVLTDMCSQAAFLMS